MAFQVSPGVLVQEKDLTNVIPAVATTIGAVKKQKNIIIKVLILVFPVIFSYFNVKAGFDKCSVN